MNLWDTLTGIIEVRLTGAELTKTLSSLSEGGIEIRNLKWMDELTCSFRVPQLQFHKVRHICVKRGDALRVQNRYGLFRILSRGMRRRILLVGLLLFFTLTVFLPHRILFTEVDGNHRVSSREILDKAEAEGVFFGSSRKDIRSEKIKNSLLSEIPRLQWLGVNTAGCVARISVRERSPATESESPNMVTRIVADRDGYILSGTVEQGTGCFSLGQTVREGQTLISGYSDCGFCIRAVRAKGEIRAQTNRRMSAVMPDCCLSVGTEGRVKRKISLRFRKKRINLWKDSGIPDATCGRMYKEYYIALPGNFRLPVALCVDEYTVRNAAPVPFSEDAFGMLRDYSRNYLRQQMIAGSILNADEQFKRENGLITFFGSYICEEMIGREQSEQIGEIHGKNN